MRFEEVFEDVHDVVGEMISNIRSSGQPVVLFGAGYCLPMFIDLCITMDIKMLGIVDNRKGDYTVQGIPVTRWDEFRKSHTGFQIIITTSYFDEIKEQLSKEAFEGNIYHLPAEAYYKNSIYSLEYVKKECDNFRKVYDNFEDDISRKVFLGIVKHNVSLNNRHYEDIKKYEIDGYFGTDLYKNRNDEIIVDGGAFDGDTVREFQSHKEWKYKRIYSFEPDKSNFLLLKNNIVDDEKEIPVCAGLGEKCEIVNFKMGGGVSSKVDPDGEESIQIETLDHFFSKEAPTFIKMDIEGAEESALLGGVHIIGEYLPTLAISAYHKKEDLFYLPQLIQELGRKQYKIYLRHTFFYQKVKIQPDVIIYAVKR